jgi:anti-sigma B factor antagonist
MEVDRVGETAVVRVRGSADMAEADKLKDQLELLAGQSVRLIVLELSALEFMGSSALGALLNAHAKLRRCGGQVRLVSPQPLVLRLLQTTCLTRLFAVFKDALAS